MNDIQETMKSAREIMERSKKQLEELRQQGNSDPNLIQVVQNNYNNAVNIINVLKQLDNEPKQSNDGDSAVKVSRPPRPSVVPSDDPLIASSNQYMTREEYRKMQEKKN